MINRELIRIRIVQIIYSWYQSPGKDLNKTEKDLLFGLEKSYDLYYFLLLLILDITELHINKIEIKKNKLLPSDEDLNPNLNLANNQFIKQLNLNIAFKKYLSQRPMSWSNNKIFVKKILSEILQSDIYLKYSSIENPSYEDDKYFWRKIFKEIISSNDELYDILEDESIFWNDDIAIVITFVLKTISKFSQENGENQILLPMFKYDEDKEFAITLLIDTIVNGDKYRSLIEKHLDKWDYERVAFVDLIIMQIAISEICTFSSIPISASLNEYIEIAKAYSTEKSGMFINGVLDSIVSYLKSEKIILKTK